MNTDVKQIEIPNAVFTIFDNYIIIASPRFLLQVKLWTFFRTEKICYLSNLKLLNNSLNIIQQRKGILSNRNYHCEIGSGFTNVCSLSELKTFKELKINHSTSSILKTILTLTTILKTIICVFLV